MLITYPCLEKQHKKVEKYVKLDASISKSQEPAYDLKAALAQIRLEPIPNTVEAKEKYFLENVALGEQLLTRGNSSSIRRIISFKPFSYGFSGIGPLFEFPAALAFYRALRVYPAPVELIMIYQKTVPEPVFKIVMELTNHDVSPGGKDDGIDEDTGVGAGDRGSATASRSTSRRGPPSETSSQEWDTLTDPGPPSASG